MRRRIPPAGWPWHSAIRIRSLRGGDPLYGWLVSPAAEDALALQSRAVCTLRALALASVGGGMDGVAPAYDELLCDCHSRCTAMYNSPRDGL